MKDSRAVDLASGLGEEVQTILREASRPAPEPGEIRILCVDDDAASQAVFSRCMSARGFHVDAVATSKDALRSAARRAYGVIVSELRVQDCDGLALITELRSLQPDAIFALASANTNDLVAPNPLLGLISVLLRKPWDEAELGRVLANAYEQHQQRTHAPSASGEDHWSVLLVEDDRDDAQRITQFLKSCGACGDVAHCSRLTTALALLQAQTFDVVIADVDGQDVPATAVIERLKEAAPEAAMIALSVAADSGTHTDLQDLGAQEQLVKGGFDRDGLRRHLQSAVAEKRLERGF